MDKPHTAPAFAPLLVAVFALGACGGGGEPPAPPPVQNGPPIPSPSPPPAPALLGAFGGRLAGTVEQDLIVVVGEAGERLLGVYGLSSADGFKPTGLLSAWGSSGSSSKRFISQWLYDYDGGSADSIDVSLDPSVPDMSGSVGVWPPGPRRTISGGALPAVGYRIADVPRLETIAGRWTLETSRGVSLTIDIAADGRLSSPSGACRVTEGRMQPSASGNVYWLYMDTAGCNLSASWADTHDVAGFAAAYARPDGAQQLVIGADNAWELVYGFIAAAGKR